MALLQKALVGYSDFIGRFRGGQVGLQDVEVLQPVISIEDFINERKNDAFSTSLTAVNQFSSLAVPEGKKWRVHSAAATFDENAGQTVNWSIMVRKNFGASAFFGYYNQNLNRFTNTQGTMNIITEDTGIGITNMDLVLDAGDEVGVIMTYIQSGAGNFDFDFFAQYTEWSI